MKKQLVTIILLANLNITPSDPVIPNRPTVAEFAKSGFDLHTARFFVHNIYGMYIGLLSRHHLPLPSDETGVEINVTISDPRLDCGGFIQHTMEILAFRALNGRYTHQHEQRNTTNKSFFETELEPRYFFHDAVLTDEVSKQGVREILKRLEGHMPRPSSAQPSPGHFVNFHAAESSTKLGTTLREIYSTVDMTGTSYDRYIEEVKTRIVGGTSKSLITYYDFKIKRKGE